MISSEPKDRFERHLFISYAHLDNVPLQPEQPGWITRLHDTLKAVLGMRLGKKAEVWRVTKEIKELKRRSFIPSDRAANSIAKLYEKLRIRPYS